MSETTTETLTSAVANPLPKVASLALKSADMLIASLEVISHRTNQMLAASTTPDAEATREFALMSQEKLEAASESGQAIMGQLYSFNQSLCAAMLQQYMLVSSDVMSLAMSKTPAEFMQRQIKLSHSLIQGAAAGSKLARSGTKLAEHGLAPIHKRVTANAKRLTDAVKTNAAKIAAEKLKPAVA